VRILLINSLYAPFRVGGAERSVQELAEGFVGLGHEVCVLTLAPASADLPEEETVNGVLIRRHKFIGPWPFDANWKSKGSLRKLIWHLQESFGRSSKNTFSDVTRDFQPQIVNTHNVAGFGRNAWKAVEGLPLVHTLRDYQLICIKTTRYRNGMRCESQCVECKFFTLLFRANRARPDAFIGVSRFTLEVRLGFIGRIEEEKGVLVVLGALEKLGPNFVTHVAGIGADEIITKLENHPRVTYQGFLPSEEFLSTVDILLIPTQWDEPFGRVAVEGRDARLPIVASKAGGLPEVLEGYPLSLLVEQFSSAEAWLQAIVKANDLRTRGGSVQPRTEKALTPHSQYMEVFNSRVGCEWE
jgi:glycosyltransferase involved in cell wall biosynthesis